MSEYVVAGCNSIWELEQKLDALAETDIRSSFYANIHQRNVESLIHWREKEPARARPYYNQYQRIVASKQ